MLNAWIMIGFFGLLGTLIRALSVNLTGEFAPWATLIINAIGSFAVGYVQASNISDEWKMYIAIGFLGALTTFSGFASYLINWFESNDLELAGMYFLATNFICLGACYFGYKAAPQF